MEYCPFCQKWVEPKKGHTDLVAGIAGSLVLGNLRPLAAGAGHYALKGSRCPICNNVISGIGAKTPLTPAQMQPIDRQYAVQNPGLQTSPPIAQYQQYSPPTTSPARVCVRCGTALWPKEKRCPNCRVDQPEPGMKFCTNCGCKILQMGKFCPRCGERQSPE